MHILILGSSGQIGTNLALRLQSDGHRVFGVDKRPNQWTDEVTTLLQDLSVPYSEFAGGIGDADYPEDIDVVVHLAAHAKVHELVGRPHLALENVNMTFNALEYCRVNRRPIVFSSSREVYGDIRRYITEESHADFAFTESPYSASKISGEAFIYSYSQCFDIPYVVFRFSNVYGRFDNDLERMERVIPLFARKMMNGEPITIYGREKVLDFTFVDDCVEGVSRGIQLLAERRERDHTINLAFGQGNSLTAVAELIAGELGVEPEIHYESDRVGEVTHYVANIGKARALLGYTPEVSLPDGIKRAVAWYRETWPSKDGRI